MLYIISNNYFSFTIKLNFLKYIFTEKFMNMKKDEDDPNNTMKSEEQMLQTRKRFMLLFL